MVLLEEEEEEEETLEGAGEDIAMVRRLFGEQVVSC
jgi:hypothetical protein